MRARPAPPSRRRAAGRVAGVVAGWFVVALLSFAAFGFAFSLTAEPAAADNCKELVKGFKDLLDEANVQDCLRTGGPYGAVLGTVVAATAAGVAAAGLGGRNSPPDDGPPVEDNPCQEALNMKQHLLDLFAKRQAKQVQITQEWQQIAGDAAQFAVMYRTLKEQEFKLGQMRVYATVGYTSAVAATLTGLAGTFVSIGEAAMTRWAAVKLAQSSVSGQLLGGAGVAVKAAASGAAALAIATQVPTRSFDPADFTGGVSVKPLWDKISQVAGSYQTMAHHFNDAARAWANNAQQDLADIDQDIANAQSRFRTGYSLCHSEMAPEDALSTFEPSGTIMVPQAQTQFGSVWWFGGSWGML